MKLPFFHIIDYRCRLADLFNATHSSTTPATMHAPHPGLGSGASCGVDVVMEPAASGAGVILSDVAGSGRSGSRHWHT